MDKFCSCLTHLTNNISQGSDEQLSGFDHETVFKAIPLIDAPVVASIFPFLAVVDEGVRPVELLNDGVLHSLNGQHSCSWPWLVGKAERKKAIKPNFIDAT